MEALTWLASISLLGAIDPLSKNVKECYGICDIVIPLSSISIVKDSSHVHRNIDVNTRSLGRVKNNLFSWPHVGSGNSSLEAELLSLQERLNTNPSYTWGGPEVGLLWASSIFHPGGWRSVITNNRLIELKCHFIMLSIFNKTLMLWSASSATEFPAGNKVLRSFTNVT